MRIILLHASAGYGHYKVAEAIREGLIASGVRESEIVLKDALDETPPWFKHIYTSLYFNSVKYTPWLWGASYELADHAFSYQMFGRHLRRIVNGLMGKRLVELLFREKPDAVVCTHFMAPEVIGYLKTAGLTGAYLLTVITDFDPHTFWVNPGTDHYWVMSDEGKLDLERRGVPPEQITAGGIPVSLKFRPAGKKEEVRRREGLELNRFTIFITSGSFGLGPAKEVIGMLEEFSKSVQALVVCGKNEDQFKSLKNLCPSFPLKVYGFVSNMDELMEASDLLVAKPGGATTSESLAKGVPMIVLAPIPGQETGNANLLKQRNAAFFLGRSSDIRTLVKGILDYPQVLEEKKRSIQKLAKPDAALNLARFLLSKIKK